MNVPVTSVTAAQKVGIVDCDIHPVQRSTADLYPSMSQRWREHSETFGGHIRQGLTGMQVYPRMMAAGQRADAYPPGGGPPGSDLDFMRRQQFMDQTGYLVDDVLVKVDRASMACGLEVRVPLLDHRVVAFAWSLPAHMKVRHGRGKWLLRQVLGRHVPPEAMSGAKTGFAVPLESWLHGPLREWVGDLLASARVRQDPLLDASRVQSLHDAFAQGGRVDPHQLWCLLMYRTWADHWSAAS
jgi:asparagine synthase (glutamine-hydrolysing)